MNNENIVREKLEQLKNYVYEELNCLRTEIYRPGSGEANLRPGNRCRANGRKAGICESVGKPAVRQRRLKRKSRSDMRRKYRTGYGMRKATES